MKKILMTAMLFCATFLFCGCTKSSYVIEIDNKDNITYSAVSALDTSMIKQMVSEAELQKFLEEFSSEAQGENYQVEKYTDGKYEGIIASKKFKISDLNYVELPEPFKKAQKTPFVIKKTPFKVSYKLDIYYNFKKAMQKLESSSKMGGVGNVPKTQSDYGNEVLSKRKYVDEKTGEITEETTYKNGMKSRTKYQAGSMPGLDGIMNAAFAPIAELTIKLPIKAKSHNATLVKGEKEYYWKLSDKDLTRITIEYEKTRKLMGEKRHDNF